MIDKFIHKTLQQPYKLRIRLRLGTGEPMLLLHGINADYSVWNDLARHIPCSDYEFIAVDLLGFGKSPKPQWKKYNIDDHVEAIVATMQDHKFKPPWTIIGHSMGSLIAVELMKRYPELIDRAILVSLPLYPSEKDLADTSFGKPNQEMLNTYYSIYRSMAADKKGVLKLTKEFRSLTNKYGTFDLNDENYHSFTESLDNAILVQNAFGELLNTKITTDIIYGRFDPLVINKYIKYIANHNPQVNYHAMNSSHDVTKEDAAKIATVLDLPKLA